MYIESYFNVVELVICKAYAYYLRGVGVILPKRVAWLTAFLILDMW